jgi:hypothetical protein
VDLVDGVTIFLRKIKNKLEMIVEKGKATRKSTKIGKLEG